MSEKIRFLLKFGEREHVEEFVTGVLYCSNAKTFWGIEDKLKIKGQGDILEAGMKTFAQRMVMQEHETGKITVINTPVNALAHIEPAERIPVFCMFAVCGVGWCACVQCFGNRTVVRHRTGRDFTVRGNEYLSGQRIGSACRDGGDILISIGNCGNRHIGQTVITAVRCNGLLRFRGRDGFALQLVVSTACHA